MATRGKADQKVADRYEFVSPLGSGGMGKVWRARDTLLERDVAVKEVRLPPELPPEERDGMQARVLREARAAGRLSHPSVVTIFDVVQSNGDAYIVMELVNAPTLSKVVGEEGPLPPERAAGIGKQLLSALERAHREGIVHRDVKPGNVMVAPDGRVKLADFGIASLKGDPKITATGLVLGSPSFMAPEQAEGTDSGPPADLWALGATLYFATEGRPPFDKGQPLPTLTAVVNEDPEHPSHAGPLAPVIMKLLAKSPADRPSRSEVHDALEAVASGAAPSGMTTGALGEDTAAATASPHGPSVADEPEPTPEPAATPPTRMPVRPRPRPAPWVFAAALLVLALVAILVLPGLLEGPGTPGVDRGVDSQQESGGPAADGGEEAPAEGGGSVPATWTTYTDSSTGWEISHPPGWQVETESVDDDSVDISDPETGAYMRIDWATTPATDTPEGAWEEASKSFAASHDNYNEIQITSTTYKGMDAAIWEFTYSEGGTDLHATDLGFVQDDDFRGALFFNAPADQWEALQTTREAMEASFQPPG